MYLGLTVSRATNGSVVLRWRALRVAWTAKTPHFRLQLLLITPPTQRRREDGHQMELLEIMVAGVFLGKPTGSREDGRPCDGIMGSQTF